MYYLLYTENIKDAGNTQNCASVWCAWYTALLQQKQINKSESGLSWISDHNNTYMNWWSYKALPHSLPHSFHVSFCSACCLTRIQAFIYTVAEDCTWDVYWPFPIVINASLPLPLYSSMLAIWWTNTQDRYHTHTSYSSSISVVTQQPVFQSFGSPISIP